MLATIGIVDCIFRHVGLHPSRSILVHGERPFYFRLNGVEQNENVTFFCLVLVGLVYKIYSSFEVVT